MFFCLFFSHWKELKEAYDKEVAQGIETYAWPSILRGRNLIGIGVGIADLDNVIAYIPPLITLLSDKKSYHSVPRGTSVSSIL